MSNSKKVIRRLKSVFYYYLPMVLAASVLVAGIVFFADMAKNRKVAKDKSVAAIAEEKKVTEKNIEVLDMESTVLVDDIDLPGIVRPWESVTLKAEVSGQVVEILKDEGDYVKKGEVIARIDKRDYKASVKEAEANLELKKKDLSRSKTLLSKNIISTSEYDAVVAPALAAEAELELAQLKLERCEIKASFDGVINKRYIQLGALLSAGSNVVDVLDTQKVRVNIYIPEGDVLAVSNLDEAEISLTQNDNKVYQGKKIFLSQQPNDNAQAYLMQFEVDNKDGLLRPGMFVEGRIVKRVSKEAYMLPAFSVIAQGTKAYCYVAEDGVARKREIKTGILKGDMVEIVSGIGSAEKVIVKGQRQLNEGDLINIVNRGSSNTAGSGGGSDLLSLKK